MGYLNGVATADDGTDGHSPDQALLGHRPGGIDRPPSSQVIPGHHQRLAEWLQSGVRRTWHIDANKAAILDFQVDPHLAAGAFLLQAGSE